MPSASNIEDINTKESSTEESIAKDISNENDESSQQRTKLYELLKQREQC